MNLPLTFNSDLHDFTKIMGLRSLFSFLGHTGLEVFKIGLGTGHIALGVDFDENGEPVGDEYQMRASTIHQALSEGINYIDTAPLYGAGKSEKILGKALQGIPRESYYLATKIGRNHRCQFDFSPRGVRETFELSLKNLRMESVDLITIHDVEFADNLDAIVKDVIPILEQYKREGKLRFIGCSGYPLQPLVELNNLAKGKLDYALSYGRTTLFNTDLLKCSPLVNNDSLGLINASPLGMGLLTPKVLGDPPVPYWHPAAPELVHECVKAAQLCQSEGVSLPRLATHYTLNKCPRASTTLIGMNSLDELATNLSILKEGLTTRELKIESEIEQMLHQCPKTQWEGVELARYHQDPQQFADFLLNGPKSLESRKL